MKSACLSLLLCLSLPACTGGDVLSDAPVMPVVLPQVVADAPVAVQAVAADVLAPAVVETRAAVEAVTPSVVTPPAARGATPAPLMSGAGVSLLIEHEIVSPAYYTRRLQGIACPGGNSGPTRGIGWDDGMQTRARIAAAWAAHPQLERILPASGQTGQARCRAWRDANRDIRTPYALAESVFVDWALPDYHAQTARVFRNGFAALPPHAQDSLVMTVYNRGGGMSGARRAEMRTLRDVCVPAGDTACMAAQYRQMVRLWRGTDIETGMRKRYEDTARLAEGRLQ